MSDVLGMQLVALYWMHGVEGAWHGFMKLNDHSYLAFVQTPAIEKIERVLGVSHSGSPGAASAGGTMQHLALNVDTLDELLALRDRIRSRGLTVVGPIHHGMCDSIYFAGPEDLSLEISTSQKAIDARAWIDPEVVALAGISAAELARYESPEPISPTGGALPQPPLDRSKPTMRGWPPGLYEALAAMPDEEFTARMSETEPPVKVD
jgi:catechol 2,3-dioxygenase-like lactoylglutathione lyase family enzyme